MNKNLKNVFSLKIGGQAGQGIKSAGLMFAKVATRSGYCTFDYSEYPSLIRGGHNMMQIIVSDTEVRGAIKKTDLVIALNQETIDKYSSELGEGGGILFDENRSVDQTKIKPGVNLFPIPLGEMAAAAGDKDLFSNTVALGAIIALLSGSLEILKNLISEEFGHKGAKVIEINHQAAESGYNFAKEKFKEKIKNNLVPLNITSPKIIVNGNDAIVLGAIAAGLQFSAIYPMTPITGILHQLAQHQGKYGYIYKQPEDEISAINMSIGASFAGARSMTATSGGGFSLMAEGYGLAGMTETPLVIVEGMRPGPATGLPTWSEQGDLRFVLHAHQGDFLRIVLAPGDAKEAFELSMKAFNLAEKYQTPVVLLVDKNLCEHDQSFEQFDPSAYQINRGKINVDIKPDYKRFQLSEDGISERTIPGTGNFLIANSDEHNELGYSSEEADNRTQQMEKRMKKLETCIKEDMEEPQLFGPENADITLVSWGSNKGNILDAMENFDNVNYLHIAWLNPFPGEAIKASLAKAKHIINIECNYSGQLAGLIKETTGITIEDKLLKFDGRPIFTEEIVEKINTVLGRN